MKIARRFLLAPSLARLVRKERGSSRVTQGFFPTQSGRNTHVHLEGGQCHLVLVIAGAGEAATEERTEVPRAHADALLDVCPGKIVYERARINVSGREVFVDRYSSPTAFDLIVVEFEDEGQANSFNPPGWFDVEVTRDSGYDNRLIALQGPPSTGEVEVTNASLEALIDTLENRVALTSERRSPAVAPLASQPRRSNDDVMDALRRLAASSPAGGAAGGAATASAAAAAAAAPSPAPAEEEQEHHAEHFEEQPAPEASADEAPAEEPEHAPEAGAQMPEVGDNSADSRLDDVIAGLSQVLGSPGDRPAPKTSTFPSLENIRFGGRIRRSEG